MRKTAIYLLFALSALPTFGQALRLPRPSPNATLTQSVGLTDITIKYSRPGVKGRQIWGALVPWDTIWRTGANEATTINFSDDVTIDGQKLAKGTYALFTIPGKDEWTIGFNSQADQWGAFNHDKSKDVLMLKVKPETGEFREWMEFEIPEMTTDTAKIALRWEKIVVPFTVDTKSTEKAMAGVKQAMTAVEASRWQTPYRAADFAFQNNRMDEAKAWLDQAAAVKENTQILWLKARMLNKEGKKAEAKKAVDAALAKAGEPEKDLANEIRRLSALW
jgi:hypothetical protein